MRIPYSYDIKGITQRDLWGALIILMIALLILFITNAFSAEPIQKTFTLTINSKQVVVNLPAELPDMDTAMYAGEECFNLKVCRQEFCLNPLPNHDHVDFMFTDQGEVFALIWIRTLEAEYMVWKYVDGMPVLSTLEEIKAIILGDKKLKETGGISWNLFLSL